MLIMTRFSYKLYRQDGNVLLAISDAEIVGRTLEEGGLEIVVSEDFYAGSECDGKKALELVRSSTIVNAIGRRIVDLLVRERFIDRANILVISGVPHAQIIAVE